jgi:hypothetical protein
MWTTVIILLFAIPGAVLAAVLIGRLAAGGRAKRGDLTAFQPLAVTFTPDREAQVRELIARGRKIEAIKLVREETGLGLKDAKDYCDALRAGRLPPVAPLSDRVRELSRSGDHAGAITLVCAETGMSQAEAEEFVRILG